MTLRQRAAAQLKVSEDDLVWSPKSLNPETTYNHEDGTIKGELGYWVLTNEYIKKCKEK